MLLSQVLKKNLLSRPGHQPCILRLDRVLALLEVDIPARVDVNE